AKKDSITSTNLSNNLTMVSANLVINILENQTRIFENQTKILERIEDNQVQMQRDVLEIKGKI
ncbi:MAG TPA: hypothetical protein VKR58_02955, partial [Aquella sp.]|nr:hypothetical protein [Aquella sp.]